MSSSGSAGVQPTSFHANVNRAKTKKWVEAKSYSYDGDDWGEVDDYDEYGGYDEPPPVSKPTGLRQRGQSASQVPQEAHDARQDLYRSPVDSRQQSGYFGGPYGQQQHGGRNYTGPQPQHHPAMARTNSFNRDDERRAFSAGSQQRDVNDFQDGHRNLASPPFQGQTTAAHDFQPSLTSQSRPEQVDPDIGRPPLQGPHRSSMEGQSRFPNQAQSPGGNFRGQPYFDPTRQPGNSSRTESMTSNSSGLELHSRRDFSPSAMPPPLQTQGSPSPYRSSSRSSSRHPPRKSSLGQDNAPTIPFPTQGTSVPPLRDAQEGNDSGRDWQPSGAGKALPFVRPADIYRRMTEEKEKEKEKEKERQSQESSRPSMDAVLGKPSERSAPGRSQDSESSQRLKPSLDPVSERKNEYAMEGVDFRDQETHGERRPTSSKTFAFPKRTSDTAPQIQASNSSLGPLLPDVSRMSGFGESFFGSTGENSGGSQGKMVLPEPPSMKQPQQAAHDTPQKDLQHQPSLGFTSAVHQAFDKAEDQVPPTPSSTQGSSVGRSASGGTSTVSPIISRGPSTATDNLNSKLGSINNVSTPTIPEGPEGSNSRPLSSTSLGTPTQVTRKPSPSQIAPPLSPEEPPPSFIPGYRRSSDTPSFDNSPRRIPALEMNRQLRQPQEIEIGAATPTDPAPSTKSSSQTHEAVSDGPSGNEQPTSAVRTGDNQFKPGGEAAKFALRNTESTGSPISPPHDLFRGRTDSSSSSRVRNLADKFENGSRPGSAHSTTPRASTLGVNATRKDDLTPQRPLADRMESFRPHLPGGWESSASIAPVAVPNPGQASAFRQPDHIKPFTEPTSKSPNNDNPMISRTSAPAQSSPVGQIKDASEEAFAAVAAAGTALAGAFGAAIGMEPHQSASNSHSQASDDHDSPKRQSRDHEVASDDSEIAPTRSSTSSPTRSSRQHMPSSPSDEETPDIGTSSTKRPQHASDLVSESPSHNPVATRDQGADSSLASSEDERPLKQPPTLPSLNTDTRSRQYESDRLRKEIVRELTPMSASEPTTADTDYSIQQPILSTPPSVTRPGHESGVLPREYESYWNDAVSDDEADDVNTDQSQARDANPAHNERDLALVKPLRTSREMEGGSVALVAQEDISQDRPHMLPHRFSWEQPLQVIPPKPAQVPEQTISPGSDFLKSAVYPEGHIQPQHPISGESQTSPLIDNTEPVDNEFPGGRDPASNEAPGYGLGIMDREKELPKDPGEIAMGRSVADYGPAAPSASDKAHDDNTDHESPSLFDSEKPATDHPLPDPPAQTTPTTAAQIPDLPSMPSSINAQLKVPAFREILALKTPDERIRAYNDTREQFANLNIGLAHWLAATANSLPQHADLLASSGRPVPNIQGHKPSPSRSKLGGLLPTGGQAGSQPYLQQSSEPNPHSSVADRIAPDSGIGAGPGQGPSSGGSSGKLSSQQVQAKGKDLLHTAGVFGGKANVAAKGLFSKGKSKLRAASGNEKASSQRYPSHASLPTEIQQQAPSVEAGPIAQSPSDIRTQASATFQQREPRETPSVESFTPSQLGDDERSSESELSTNHPPPRTSSLYLKHGLADLDGNASSSNPIASEDNVSRVSAEPLSASTYVASPREVRTPQSTTSSNRTPTQANFIEDSPRGGLQTRHGHKTKISSPSSQEILSPDNRMSTKSQPSSSSHPYFSTQAQNDVAKRATTPTNRDAFESALPTKQSSGDSKSTIRHVGYLNDAHQRSADTTPLESPIHDVERMSRAPARMNALRESEVSPSRSLTTSPVAQSSSSRRSTRRSRSRKRDSLGVPGSPNNYPVPKPGDDLNHHNLDQPPSPVSPYQPTSRETRGRTGPIHYGLDHDFVPESDHEKRTRSRNYSSASVNTRSSQDSRRFQERNSTEHPEYRTTTDVPSQFYSGQIPRDRSLTPRQQAPEYQLEGTSPPLEWPTEETSRSRRGSRSSAFFKSFASSSSTKLDEPPLPVASNSPVTSPIVKTPTTDEKKSKRTSLLHSLTGTSGNNSGYSKEFETPVPSIPQYPQQQQQQHIATKPSQSEDDEFPSRGNSRSAASKFNGRLHKSSTVGPEGSKKKRFSGLGSLFGRGNQKRQSSLSSQAPQQQQPPPPPLPQQDDPYSRSSFPDPRQSEHRPTEHEYPPAPAGGYYAPRTYHSPPPLNPVSQRTSKSPADTPAYIQDAALRQPMEKQMSPTVQSQNPPPRTSATFPRTSPQQSSPKVPRSLTGRTKDRESTSQRQGQESKPPSSSWMRFSQHGRSKSKHEKARQPLDTPPQSSYQQSAIATTPITSNPLHQPQRPHPEYPRSESPPPPPPPPKDEWHRSQPRQSSSRASTTIPRHAQSLSQSSIRPVSSTHRQSLPPLQTNVAKENNRKSGTISGRMVTPEEKRRSRQHEIERSSIPPQSPAYAGRMSMSGRGVENDEPVVMSATSFPGQEWQPSYAHWDGD